jgi:hypothetical protein
MTKKKARNTDGQVYEGSYLIDLMHDFWESGNGERLVALPSLNDNVPGLFDDYSPLIDDLGDDDPEDPDSLEISRIEEGTKIRFLTDVHNKPDWRTLWDFLQYPEIEIRHVQNLDMFLLVHLGEKRAFSIVSPTRDDGSYNDFEDRSIATETSDYKPFQWMFDELWENAEPMTCEKIEHFNELRSDDREDSDKELLQHTYFLFPEGKKDDCELQEERDENLTSRGAFCGEIELKDPGIDSYDYIVSLAYIVGIKIPKDAEQIIICHVDEKRNRIKYDQAFRVFGNSPIREIDETLEFYYPERGFSIVQGWNDDSVVADAYPRPKRYYSKNIYMAMQVFDFDFEKNSRKVEKALSKKFRTDAAFADSLKETCFVKWSDVLRIESDSKN